MNTNTQPSAGAAKKKSPLDVLEDILEDSKKGKAPAKPAKLTPEQEEQQLAQVKQQQEMQIKTDRANIQTKLQEIAGLKDSPQVQAAEKQEQAEQEEKVEHESFMKGNEIIQIGHKKI